jgi:small subunit ribosomal protein S15
MWNCPLGRATRLNNGSRQAERREEVVACPMFATRFSLFGTRVAAMAAIGNPQQIAYCLGGQRFRWTKAKKKRQIRMKRREADAAKGKSIPKPPLYLDPKQTPVVGAFSRAEQEEHMRQEDAKMAEELRARLSQQTKLLRFHMTGLRMSDRVRKLFDLNNGNQEEVVKAQKQQGMEVFQKRPGDTGSSAVQVIALTTRIQNLQTHMAMHKKDYHNKRGMDALFIRRRKVLDYMERKDFESYRKVVKTLGLNRS